MKCQCSVLPQISAFLEQYQQQHPFTMPVITFHILCQHQHPLYHVQYTINISYLVPFIQSSGNKRQTLARPQTYDFTFDLEISWKGWFRWSRAQTAAALIFADVIKCRHPQYMLCCTTLCSIKLGHLECRARVVMRTGHPLPPPGWSAGFHFLQGNERQIKKRSNRMG